MKHRVPSLNKNKNKKVQEVIKNNNEISASAANKEHRASYYK